MAVTCTRNVQVIVRCGVITVYYLSVLCSGSDKAPPPLRLETIGINCGGDMGVRRCLARSLTSLAFRCALQRVQTVPAAIHSGRIPPPRPTSHGDGRLRQPPSPHRTWSVPDASSGPQLNLQSIALLTKRHWAVNSNIRIRLKRPAADSLMN